MRADLHIHTAASDGLLTPAEVVNAAAANGLGLFAVTDHDTVEALPHLSPLCAAAGIKYVPGIEVSAYLGDVKLHTLGYNIDYGSARFKKFLKELKEGSFIRLEGILAKLRGCGIYLTAEECAGCRLNGEVPVHVMHVCRAAVKKGYAADEYSFFAEYTAYGKPAYCNLARPSPERTVEEIKAAGGIAVLAHPGRITMQREELRCLISRLAAIGLDGIEAVYSGHTERETEYFKGLAEEYNLLVTGGSDTHVFSGNRVIGCPEFVPSEELLRRLNIG